MTQTRRGFFGRVAALFAAPVVAKLPGVEAPPDAPGCVNMHEEGGRLVKTDWSKPCHITSPPNWRRLYEGHQPSKTLADAARELDPEGHAERIAKILGPKNDLLDDIVWKEV